MKSVKNIILIIVIMLISSCMKNEYDIDYQLGYPNSFADNWIAFEFQGGDLQGDILEPYNLVTSLDPNRPGYLIIDKLYNSTVRVRAEYSDSSFVAVMSEQLDVIGTQNYGIDYVSVSGYITTNPYPRNIAYQAANIFFENMAFEESDIQDVIFLRAGFYDAYKSRIDTALIIGYRKTGFEDIDF